jgi:ferredoxin
MLSLNHIRILIITSLQVQYCRQTNRYSFQDIFNKDKQAKTDAAEIEFLPKKVTAYAKIGDELSDVAKNANIEIQYKCKKGECGTCEVNVQGKWIKACQTKITSNEPLKITVKEYKKKPAFFSPQSLADGFNNNVLGMVGLVTEGIKVDDEYQARMIKEKKLADLVAAKKAEKNAK